MAESDRSYTHALSLLDTIASNRTIVAMIQDSGRDMNLDAIPEMLEWVRKAGYAVEDFNKLKVIHVAGTKGKGSVCAMVDSILRQYSEPCDPTTGNKIEDSSDNSSPRLGKVGLFTSPHLITPRERIRLNGAPISEDLFAKYFFDLWDRFTAAAVAENHLNPNSAAAMPGYFRYVTIMALHAFLKEGVQTAIMECGIGGEYDSTNILTKEATTVSVITKLGIDHVGMLGHTIEKIAWHKAGIMKEGVECVTAVQPEEAEKVLVERAQERHTNLKVVKRRSDIDSGDVKLGLEGDFQKDNASLAVETALIHLKRLGVIELSGEDLPVEFMNGLQNVEWHGRCEVIQEDNIEWCIDGAHTMDSIDAAARWFGQKWLDHGKKTAVLIFNSQLRDAPALATALNAGLERVTGDQNVFWCAIFPTNIPFKPDPKQFDPCSLQLQEETCKTWKKASNSHNAMVTRCIEDAISMARMFAAGHKDDGIQYTVLVTGSLHLVGGFLQVLKS